jgi:hypothetical protein
MKKKCIFIALLFLQSMVFAQEYSGGIDAGLSYTNLNDSDSLTINPSFSPTIGFSINRSLQSKWYLTVGSMFTLRNGMVLTPNRKFRSLYLDWRLSLRYKPLSILYVEAGAVAAQFLNGRVESGFTSRTLSGEFKNQISPFVGVSVEVNNYLLNAKYYIPRVIVNAGSFSPVNQFSYAELSITIPISSKKSNSESEEKKANIEEAKQHINELKNGILLVVLSSGETKQVKDKELDNLIVKAFQSNYSFSRYFVVDEADIDALISTGKISVYESYPYLVKQTIDLTNLTWYYAKTGKNTLEKPANNEVFEVNGIFIYDSSKQKLKYPFPFYMQYTGTNVDTAVKSINAEFDRYYYQTVFGK